MARDWAADTASVPGVSDGDRAGSPLVFNPATDPLPAIEVGGENMGRLTVLVKVGDVVAERFIWGSYCS